MNVDVPNSNGRMYSKAAIQNAIVKASVSAKELYCTIGDDLINHFPNTDEIDVKKIIGRITNLTIHDDGSVYGTLEKIDTEISKNLDQITLSQEFDFVPNGVGDIDKNGIVSNYSFLSISAVAKGTSAFNEIND